MFTDEAKTEGYGSALDVLTEGDGREKVTLAFEIMVPAVVRQDEREFIVPAAGTDAMAEAFLDMIEQQVRQRLAEARTHAPLGAVLLAVGDIVSNPWRDPDLDLRLSARRVELDCHIRPCGPWPEPGRAGLEALPAPLREVAAALPEGGYGAAVCAAIAAALGDRAVFTALSEIRLAANLDRDPGNPVPPPADAAANPPTGDLAGSIAF